MNNYKRGVNVNKVMWLKSLLVICCIQFMAAKPGMAQEVIRAADYGVHSNSFENAATGIRKAIEMCRQKSSSTLVLPGGRIDVWPEGSAKRELYLSNSTEDDTVSKVKNIAFLFEQCHNLTLEGNNTLIVLHGKMISFALIKSIAIKIKNTSFDYERPTMSELTIKSVSPRVIETAIHPDSKYLIENGHLSFYGEGWKTWSYHTILFDPVRDRLHYSSFTPFLKSKAIGIAPFAVRFEGDFKNSTLKPGDVLTMRDPYRDNCGAFILLSKDVELAHVNMYFMHGLGIVSQFSENISLFKVAVKPKENSGRIIASFADCFHFSGCRGMIKIDSCFTSGSHDDPINVHGTHLQVTSVGKKNIKVRFMHHQTYGFDAFFAGDSVAFINPKTLLPQGTAKLKSAKLINRREMELEFDGKLPAFVNNGLCVENLTWTPELIIKNSRFERTNTRGLLVTTRRKVVIENNTFYHTGMYPILIADDALSWFESGEVRDIIIRNNIFDGCGYNSGSGAICIAPENRESVPGKMVHHNISIVNNTFKVINQQVLTARSVDGLVFSGNRIESSQFFKPATDKAIIDLAACTNVTIEKNNSVSTESPTVNINGMTNADIKTDLGINHK
ncbi:MAG: right-handed parallel beta-helix repeat-containing protein [Mucilaginibacter sp.]